MSAERQTQQNPERVDSTGSAPAGAEVQVAPKVAWFDLGQNVSPRGLPPADPTAFVGRASAKGSKQHNADLALKRAETVRDRMVADMGWSNDISSLAMSFGEEHATNDPKFQRVDVGVVSTGSHDVHQNVAAHEAGHMFGLGDEYVDERPPPGALPKFLGDRPTHYGDVEAHLGADAADDLLVQDSGNIMSKGDIVQRGHYVHFLQALDTMTSKQWTIE
jgi:hypothetical protein